MRINKVLVLVIGAVLLLGLCAGVSLLVVNNTNNHNLAEQRAAATAGHNRAVASASAAANAKAIAAANAKAAKAEADAKAARAAASNSATVPGAVSPAQQVPAGGAPQPPANAVAVVTQYRATSPLKAASSLPPTSRRPAEQVRKDGQGMRGRLSWRLA